MDRKETVSKSQGGGGEKLDLCALFVTKFRDGEFDEAGKRKVYSGKRQGNPLRLIE